MTAESAHTISFTDSSMWFSCVCSGACCTIVFSLLLCLFNIFIIYMLVYTCLAFTLKWCILTSYLFCYILRNHTVAFLRSCKVPLHTLRYLYQYSAFFVFFYMRAQPIIFSILYCFWHEGSTYKLQGSLSD